MNDNPYDTGLAIRHEIFGAEVTNRQIEGASPFLRPMQDMVTADCFGKVWARPGLDRKTRSMLTIAMLIGMGRSHELRIHVKGAISNGVSVDELGEILRHAAVYCGVPASVDAWLNPDAALRECGESSAEPQP